ncbi:MAG TPA: hemerythrin domain-containing protein [Ramlibacter sp.]|jgi:hemerythrin-like domain-containing protein|uniref:hemerythrin domain-containing protein n=1 Tax=Ramlibacter sp. TaxID=1917967 RepID=UPI002D550EC8|nr:hemerythrin domain-containing protein [Ramlibacter sp.]HZY18286.1 hemerythrin domain-containing protein [Ramlibacter sp.]
MPASSPNQLTAAPAAGFEQPFEMLGACHERVARMLDLLARLQAHVARHGADEQARQAARDVMRYFDLAAPQHHLDEERHVLPALEAAGDPALALLAARLRSDHRRMEDGWMRVRQVLSGLAEGTTAALDPAQQAALEAFAALHADHLAAEDGTAFPAAARRLDAAAHQAMSADMRQRRGVR